MPGKPVWLLDVDGVINATFSPGPRSPVWPKETWKKHRVDFNATSVDTELSNYFNKVTVWASTEVTDFIRWIAYTNLVEIRWCTTWQEDALYLARRYLHLPQFYVMNTLPERSKAYWWKEECARRVVEEEERPLIWTDDDINTRSRLDWFKRSWIDRTPFLHICPNENDGLTPEHLESIIEFCEAHRYTRRD